jgi:excisionase family DNA binding protein
MQLTITIDSDDLKPLLTEIVQQVLAGTSSAAKKPTQEVAAESIGVSKGTPSTPARTQFRQERVTLDPSPELTGSDAKHGYQFGIDGLMTVAAACETLCRISPTRTQQLAVTMNSIQTYTEEEAAALLRVKRHTLRDARLRGEISFSRIVMRRVRYTRSDLENYLKKNHVPADVALSQVSPTLPDHAEN